MITLVEDEIFVVESRAQLIAAIQAGSRSSFEAALHAPFSVELGRTRYSFPRGCTQQRADKIRANANRVHPAAFKVVPA